MNVIQPRSIIDAPRMLRALVFETSCAKERKSAMSPAWAISINRLRKEGVQMLVYESDIVWHERLQSGRGWRQKALLVPTKIMQYIRN